MGTARSTTKKNLYRIVPFERVVQLLKSNELYLSHPSTWPDPYDRQVSFDNSPDIFAQSWCRKAVSDAMWRIYSPNSLGVRIGTTRDRLQSILVTAKQAQGIEFKIQNVKYLYNEKLRFERERLQEKWNAKPSFVRSIAPAFLKRDAFDHEYETRVVILRPPARGSLAVKGTVIRIDAGALIRSIWFDPRAPKECFEAYKHYLKDILKFSGVVKQSSLYASRDPAGE